MTVHISACCRLHVYAAKIFQTRSQMVCLHAVLIIIFPHFFVDLGSFCCAWAEAAAHTHSDAGEVKSDNRCCWLKPIFILM